MLCVCSFDLPMHATCIAHLTFLYLITKYYLVRCLPRTHADGDVNPTRLSEYLWPTDHSPRAKVRAVMAFTCMPLGLPEGALGLLQFHVRNCATTMVSTETEDV